MKNYKTKEFIGKDVRIFKYLLFGCSSQILNALRNLLPSTCYQILFFWFWFDISFLKPLCSSHWQRHFDSATQLTEDSQLQKPSVPKIKILTEFSLLSILRFWTIKRIHKIQQTLHICHFDIVVKSLCSPKSQLVLFLELIQGKRSSCVIFSISLTEHCCQRVIKQLPWCKGTCHGLDDWHPNKLLWMLTFKIKGHERDMASMEVMTNLSETERWRWHTQTWHLELSILKKEIRSCQL